MFAFSSLILPYSKEQLDFELQIPASIRYLIIKNMLEIHIINQIKDYCINKKECLQK